MVNQTFEDWQCVISDDASTDKSVEIANEYQAKDTRFKVIKHKQNVGAANNWNRAKDDNESFATKILCADDYLYPDALSKQLEILKNNDSSIIFSHRQIVLPSGRKMNPKFPIYSNHISFNDAFRYYIKSGRNIFGEPVAALFRTDQFKKSDGFMPKFEYALDTSGYMTMSRKGTITFDSNVVGVFRVSKNQWSHRLRSKQFFHIFEFIDHLVEVEGVCASRSEVILGKIKVMGANLIRVIIYKFLRNK